MCDTRTSSCVRVLWILTHLIPASPVQLSACVSVSYALSLNIYVMAVHRIQVKSIQTQEARKGQPIKQSNFETWSKELKETEGGRDESKWEIKVSPVVSRLCSFCVCNSFVNWQVLENCVAC